MIFFAAVIGGKEDFCACTFHWCEWADCLGMLRNLLKRAREHARPVNGPGMSVGLLPLVFHGLSVRQFQAAPLQESAVQSQ
jgi:hypothetical protein